VHSFEVHEDHYGSVKYAAPEVLQGLESSKALDIWALGVTLYEMTHGYGPFEGGNDKEICAKILTEKWSMNSDLSHELQDLLIALLKVNPKDRPDIDAIIRHSWVQEGVDSREIGSDEAERPSLSDQSRDINPSGVGLELEYPKMIPFPSPRLIRMPGTVDRRDSERPQKQHVRGWGVLQSGNTTDDEYLRTATQMSELSPRYSICTPTAFPLLEPIPAKDLEESPSPSFTFEHILPPVTTAQPERESEEKEEKQNEADETDIVVEQDSEQKGVESMQKCVFVSVVEDFAEQEIIPNPKQEPKSPVLIHITPSGLPLRYEMMDKLLSDPDVRHSFKKNPTKRHVEDNAFMRWIGTFLGCTNRR
jgi:serine/threonine protein kinase